MVNKEYAEAAVEVLDILNHTDKKRVAKIPSKFIEFLKENSSKEYISNLNHAKTIKEMELKPKTEAILGLIYLKYWADEAGKRKFEQKIKENEEFFANELKKDFETNMFQNNHETQINNNLEKNNMLVECQREGFLSKIINKIKKIFKGE